MIDFAILNPDPSIILLVINKSPQDEGHLRVIIANMLSVDKLFCPYITINKKALQREGQFVIDL